MNTNTINRNILRPGKKSQFQVEMSHGKGSKSFEYFETLDEALAFEPPQRFDFMGYPKKRPRIMIKEFVGGTWGNWKYKKVEGLATISFGKGKVQVRI